MRAVAYQQSLPIEDEQSLQDVEIADPQPGPHDLLVEVRAVGVNPIDTKQRRRAQPAPGQWAVLGYDAVGVVVETGVEVTRLRRGDRVWYAGAIDRQGCNSQLHVVDERIVSRAPDCLDDAAAAAMPLTSLTAYELLFDRVAVPRSASRDGAEGSFTDGPDEEETRTAPAPSTLLVIGAAGGVGSMLVQMARQLTDLTVVATASRPESVEWVRQRGAHVVLDHSLALAPQVAAAGLPAPEVVLGLSRTDDHFSDIVELIAPQGRIGLIDDPAREALNVLLLKRKSVSLHWESMFTRSVFQTPDMQRQGDLLAQVAELVDAGTLSSAVNDHRGRITAATLRGAHATLEAGHSRGKIVLEGF